MVAMTIASILAVSPAPNVAARGNARVDPAPADGHPTDQVIVTYSQAGLRLGQAELEAAAGAGTHATRAFGERSDVVKLDGPRSGAALDAVMQAIARHPGVESVEPDLVMHPLDVPNDPSYAAQWDLTDPATSGVYGVNAAPAWDLTTGSTSIRIAVIDTGYLDHADLAGRFVGGYDFISDSRIANDGTARDADAHDPGDWITGADTATTFFSGCTVSNSSWHGTHVSGTIGAATNNGVGIAGLNRVSQIVPVRVLGKCGGYTSDIVDGMRWAAGLSVPGVPANPNPARVLSLSLGGSGACTSTYQTAINQITNAGAVVVVAAGNSNANAANYSPASCTGVITVAATGKTGNRSYYSNYGNVVEIAAPGGDKNADSGDTILSTLNTGLTSPSADTYTKYQGTSMATPHVSGVVSLILSANPALTPAQVTSLVQSTARPFPGGSTCAGACGAGIIDAGAAVAAAGGGGGGGTPPGAFGKVSPSNGATGQSTRPTLTWQASAGATSYQVCVDATLNGQCDTTWAAVAGNSAQATGLARRTRYEWQVLATNASGTTAANTGTWFSFTTR
jgi:serine protease